MKYLLIGFIKFYQSFIPQKLRRKCLYKTSCSNYVLKETQMFGLLHGLKALNYRFKNCNNNYQIITINDDKIIVTAQLNLISETDLNPKIFNDN